MWFKIGLCIFSFLSCPLFLQSFFLIVPFRSLFFPWSFVLYHKSYVFLHSSEDSKSFPENFRWLLAWILQMPFPYSGWHCYSFFLLYSSYNKICSLLVSFYREVCGSLSIHLVRSLPGRQVDVPSFWKTPPSAIEVDQSCLLSSPKH